MISFWGKDFIRKVMQKKQCLRNSRRVPTSLVMSCKLWKCLSSFAITLTCYSLSWHEKYETWYLSILMQVVFCHIHSIQVTIILTFLVVFHKCLIFIFSICSPLLGFVFFMRLFFCLLVLFSWNIRIGHSRCVFFHDVLYCYSWTYNELLVNQCIGCNSTGLYDLDSNDEVMRKALVARWLLMLSHQIVLFQMILLSI